MSAIQSPAYIAATERMKEARREAEQVRMLKAAGYVGSPRGGLLDLLRAVFAPAPSRQPATRAPIAPRPATGRAVH